MGEIKKRFKNKAFIFALAGFIYQLTILIGWSIPQEEFKTFVDILSYLLIGFGVYSSFDGNEGTDKGDDEK